MSLFANTLHLPATLGGFGDFSASLPNSSIVRLSRVACWSRKEPVPAAHTEFIWKSSILIFLASPSGDSSISFASSPPISITVLTSGWKYSAAFAWAMTSFVKLAPIREAMSFPPEPVAATAFILWRGNLVVISDRIAMAVSCGWPFVLV